jgi:hypothetical protein
MSQKVQHLEMVQKIITRISSNSFTMKGWTITLVVGILVLSYNLLNKNMNYSYFFIAYIPIIFFWYIDTCYLKLEQQYRILYNSIREKEESEIDFNLDYKAIPDALNVSFIKCFFSRSEVIFYMTFFLVITLIVSVNYLG